MSKPDSPNYVLITLTLIGLGLVNYLYFFIDSFRISNAGSYFLISALCGSLWLYSEFFIRPHGLKRYLIVFFIASLSLLILYQSSTIYLPPYLMILLTLWVLGLFHFLVYSFFYSLNKAWAINSLCLYLSLPVYLFISAYFLYLSGINHPLVMDEYLMATDGSLGFYPSLKIAQFIQLLPLWLITLINLIYLFLPLIFLLMYWRLQTQESRAPYDLIIEFLLIGIIGYLLYNLVPACGSHFAFFATWPDYLPTNFNPKQPESIYCPQVIPRNCLPSLHTAWVISLLRRAFLLDPYSKIIVILLCIANFIAMFGIGSHYLVDILMGLALANFIGALTHQDLAWQGKIRWFILLLSASLMLSWYALIFYGITFLQSSIFLAWLIFLSSLLLSIFMEYQLLINKDRSLSSRSISSQLV